MFQTLNEVWNMGQEFVGELYTLGFCMSDGCGVPRQIKLGFTVQLAMRMPVN